MKNKSIGVFDSGVGGLTVLNKLIDELPNENIVYFGDTARLPYGTRDGETIKRFATEVVSFLMEKDMKALVVACNTMSSFALDEIKNLAKIPVIDVIEPGSMAAIKHTKNKNIGVIATDGTIKSKSYNRMLKSMDEDMQVKGVGCPKFVDIIESGKIEKDETIKVAKEYLEKFDDFNMDTLILGCTHYPIIEKEIIIGLEELNKKNVKLIDPALETAKRTRKVLGDKAIFKDDGKVGIREYYVTGDEERFKILGNSVLRSSIDVVNKANLGNA